ncbi:gluconate 2-dehydrogenase subunit 3 family protein [Pseudomonas typographi]|uniref:Gluconate 2-dehydrogenase subunit 3 family protein n=1 Tax=Pseudomonas typographi TaxID=2715964 RepID=A0ABR7ZA75_9PSED|nr:gluconate 2-dehydrogenase subunit 3 family protein [Pseudomonas typographi]MBD1551097.1 gluconate 2-dehydrogenase subunit 3 family protein [Pseudomonas typographi]MBD1586409.1 gluconate 2-dehydrogenase subunit 3 family protein [Pseudomonas typographi]MBD1602226.1 gluconate 2-dehydrogenase subunit 3 family protein [Pseudomonas typographi]
MQRRDFLSSALALAAASTLPAARADVVSGGQPWEPGKASVPPLAAPRQGGLAFFTQAELDMAGALADRLIPADDLSIGGKEAGCAVFIDRQLAGDYGKGATLYRLGRFVKGTPEQGTQSPFTPAERWRKGLAAIDAYCGRAYSKPFVQLDASQQDDLLHAMENGTLDLGREVETKELFEQILANVREGFFADPLYGGNKNMASWKMIGFPGARYDFRDLIGKKGQKLQIIPTSLVDNTL